MRVGFFTVFRKDPQHYVLAEMLIRSVKTTMPGTEIVQFTDETSPAVHNVDTVRRLPSGKMLERRIEHYTKCDANDYEDSDWLLLDTDIYVRRDVRDVFEGEYFDVALADRNWPHLPPTLELTAEMPYNTGVVFCKNPAFWQAVLVLWRELEQKKQDWLSEQRVVARVVNSGVFNVKILPGMVYNYPPASASDMGEAAIVHYKGNRKEWMRKLWTNECTVLSCT